LKAAPAVDGLNVVVTSPPELTATVIAEETVIYGNYTILAEEKYAEELV